MEMTWFKFDDLPAGLKAIAKVREIAWKPKVGDKGLADIMNPYRGNDELRPVMMGINADEHGFTATNAHVLIHIPAKVLKAEHKIHSSDWKQTIDGRYPSYMAVVPRDNPRKYTIDLLRLDSYLAAAEHYANKITHQVVLTASETDRFIIGVNSTFMRTAIRGLRQMGHEHADLHCSEPNRAMILTPVGKQPLKDVTILIMPVMVDDDEMEAWVQDPDFGLGLASRYDLRTNTLENRDGTTTDTWTVQEGWQPSGNVTRERLTLIRHILSKGQLPVTSYAKVYDGVLQATDLKCHYELADCGLFDGYYEATSEGLKPTGFAHVKSFAEYPRINDEDLVAAVNWPVADLSDRLDIAMVLKGVDELRPQMNQHCIEVNAGRLSFTVTDANGLYRDDCKVAEDVPDFMVLPTDVKAQALFSRITDTGNIRMAVIGKYAEHTMYSTESEQLRVRNSEARYPQVEPLLKSGSHESERAIILDRKEVDYIATMLKGQGHIRVTEDGNSLHMVRVENKKLVKVKDVDLRMVNLPQPRKKLMIYMPTGAGTIDGYSAYGFGESLFITLKKLYVGRAASEFTLHYSNVDTEANSTPFITVNNPTLPDWPDDHVLGSKQGGSPLVTITPGPAKARKEAKQLEISPAAKKADTSIAIRARATATALKLKLALMKMKY